MSEWREVRLSQVSSLIVDSEHKTAPKDPQGPHPLIRTTDLGRARADFKGAQRVNAVTHQQWTRRAIPSEGDLILAREAPVGGVCSVPGGVKPVLGQRTVLVRPDPVAADGRFLMYRMAASDLQARMAEMSTGSTVPHLNMADIRELPIPDVPSLRTQRRIAAVLSAFDELIEINERRIELLEDLARSLYREWFMRLRFPGHEDVQLVDSELGPIPRPWEVGAIGDYCDLVRGRSYRRTELSEREGVAFLNLKCVDRGGGFRRSGLKRYMGRYKEAQRAFAGDVLVAVTDMTQERRIVAQAFRMPDLGDSFAVPSLDLALLRPHREDSRAFLYATLRYSGFSDSVRHFANGANVLHLAVERISEHRFAVPPQSLVDQFTVCLDQFLAERELLERINCHLSATRDLLLPRLVTGRLDISDVDLGNLLPAEAA